MEYEVVTVKVRLPKDGADRNQLVEALKSGEPRRMGDRFGMTSIAYALEEASQDLFGAEALEGLF